MCLRQFFLPVFFLLSATAAQASGISRCVQADGPPQFTNQQCPEGVTAEPLELVENTPLDSSAVRAHLAQGKAKTKTKAGSTGPQVVLIEDSYTAERNARVSDKPAKKKKNKGKKKRKTKTAAKPATGKPTKPAQ